MKWKLGRFKNETTQSNEYTSTRGLVSKCQGFTAFIQGAGLSEPTLTTTGLLGASRPVWSHHLARPPPPRPHLSSLEFSINAHLGIHLRPQHLCTATPNSSCVGYLGFKSLAVSAVGDLLRNSQLTQVEIRLGSNYIIMRHCRAQLQATTSYDDNIGNPGNNY